MIFYVKVTTIVGTYTSIIETKIKKKKKNLLHF